LDIMVSIKLIAVGDISLQEGWTGHPFSGVFDILGEKDILFGNLEAVLSNRGKKAEKAVLLNSSPVNVKYLVDVHFDILNFANNHALDLGTYGFVNTLANLRNNKIEVVGASTGKFQQQHVVLDREGIRIGFLGYTSGHFHVPRRTRINKLREKQILADIGSMRKLCDFVVISLHWGTENSVYPSPKQMRLAHTLVDHGATLVLGHGPHVAQGLERYGSGLIVYSLGNFNLDPTISDTKMNLSQVLRANFSRKGISDFEVLPIRIVNGTPNLVPIADRENVMESISRLSQKISKGEITAAWWYEQIAGTYLRDSVNSYRMRVRRSGIIPLLEFGMWALTPFSLRCYLAILRKRIGRAVKGN
jgi:poly-gamma-glutamate synthesis protein (capsule biosynthesis protein)